VAPEVLLSVESDSAKTYDHKVDWWSLGVVAFEMLVGFTPFSDDSACVTYSRIANYKAELAVSVPSISYYSLPSLPSLPLLFPPAFLSALAHSQIYA